MKIEEYQKAKQILSRLRDLDEQKERFASLNLNFIILGSAISPKTVELFESLKSFADAQIDEETAQLKKEMELL